MYGLTISELQRCMDDKAYFFENFCKVIHPVDGVDFIDLYQYQKDLVDEPFLQAKTARQIGFTTLAVLDIFHTIVFKQEKTIVYSTPTHRESVAVRDMLLDIYNNTTFPKELLPKMLTCNKTLIEFENRNNVRFIPSLSSHIRGLSINYLYMQEVDHVPVNQYDEFIHSVFPVLMSYNTSRVWLWGCIGNGNLNHKYSEKFKTVSLPFWVAEDKTYKKYKELLKYLTYDEIKRELLI